MLHYEAVPPRAVEVLKILMKEDCLKDYFLVGGTSLALRYGHRLSVDLDLFTQLPVNYEAIIQSLKEKPWEKLEQLFAGEKGMQLLLNGVKTDFVKYSYSTIKPTELIEGIRMLSVQDVASMKLSAITQRGAKKDFYDLHLLLQHFSIDELLNFFKRKYPDVSTFHVVRSLNYYDDAEEQASPDLRTNLSWEKLKADIDKKVAAYLSK